MKRMIMFVTYEFSDVSSGSKVRPMKMYQAFKSIGYEVFLISGNKELKKQAFNLLKKEEKNFDFCYVEPSSYPMQPIIDHKIIKYIKNLDIPIGVFYRDAYWKFYNQFSFKGYKNIELKIRYQLDLLFLKKISNVMFFPSSEMAKYFSFKQPKIALPPAADKNINTIKVQKNKVPTAIYVGGISKRYGTELLLESFDNINKASIKVKLLLICRENEYRKNVELFDEFRNREWLYVKHASGSLLDNEYRNADFGVIPILKDEYNDFAVPVKLFEYLSYGLPIVTTNCDVLHKYIDESNLGIVKKDNIKSLTEGLDLMIKHYPEYNENIHLFVNEYGLWEHRAKKVVESLNTFKRI